MKHLHIVLVALCIASLALAACATDQGDPAAAVEAYMQAKVSGDEAAVRALLCSEMEDQLQREVRTFSTVTDVAIENMSCEASGDERVSCTGTIVAAYGSENTEFPLTNYRVVREDDDWKWCGETE